MFLRIIWLNRLHPSKVYPWRVLDGCWVCQGLNNYNSSSSQRKIYLQSDYVNISIYIDIDIYIYIHHLYQLINDNYTFHGGSSHLVSVNKHAAFLVSPLIGVSLLPSGLKAYNSGVTMILQVSVDWGCFWGFIRVFQCYGWWFSQGQPPFGCMSNLVNNGINYQPQLVS